MEHKPGVAVGYVEFKVPFRHLWGQVKQQSVLGRDSEERSGIETKI
jgi:hypothetical protein